MSILREIFGPSKKEIWRLLSEQTGAEFVEGGFFSGPDKVVAQYGEWTITLDTYTVSTGKTSTTYTRMRAPYVNAGGFRFSIYRSGIFSELGEFLGFQDVEIGNEDFDKAFVIKSSDEDKVRELLAEPRIRELIDRQPRFHLEVKDDEGWFGRSFPEGVDELYFRVPGIIKNIERLKDLFEVFSEVLNRLCVIGAAYQSHPGVDL
jgi:hypothetical protein